MTRQRLLQAVLGVGAGDPVEKAPTNTFEVAMTEADRMNDDLLRFTVTRLSASVPEGVPITWRGRELASGPLTIELAARDEGTANQGALDYASRRARAEIHVRLGFPHFAAVLEDLGVDPALSKPVHAVLRSEGAILDDHGFALSGTCDLEPHDLLPRDATSAAVLPGQ